MTDVNRRLLKVFLCHASGDKPPVRELYNRLTLEGVDAWLDKEKLLPGQDWRMEIPRAVRDADVVVVCLSKKSITKEGYVQREIKFALDIAEEKPEGTIFLIPARLEDCTVPDRLNRWQWVDLYENDGFIKLLRSLKLRADAVGAAVEPVSYVDSQKEADRRLEQLYTEGLAAFYTEDWDRACQRFQSILSERPNHKNASEKLKEAELQRDLARLYERATDAVQNADWGAAIQILETLSQKSADYKDAAQLLRNARKQKQLRDLYAEAKALHAGKQWEAVVKVFEQISSIDPNYPDVDELLPSAQKEVTELRRLAELNDQYSHALREMDSGNWYEARRLLEAVHKSETGFLETEKLLKKVENEIVREEEQRKQNDQINTLYEQAHGLLRSKKWRNALDKMVEISKLDEHFQDTDAIAEKAKTELEREEQEAERQNKLAALYAEAVRFLKEKKYQEALDKWGEVKAVDPRYPDRQRVHNAARKALTRQAKPIVARTRFTIPKSLWIGLGGVTAIAVLVLAINQFGNGGNKASLAPTIAPKDIVIENNVLPVSTPTNVPQKTKTARPLTPVPTISGYSDPTMYDDFSNSAYEGSYNKSLWIIYTDSKNYEVSQSDGKLSLSVTDQSEISLSRGYRKFIEPTFFEARLYLDPQTTNNSTALWIEINNGIGYSVCEISRTGDYAQQITCVSEYFGKKVDAKLSLSGILPGWHILRFEIDPETMIIAYVVDGIQVGYFDPKETIPDHFDDFKQKSFWFNAVLNNGLSKEPVGYIDYVRMGAIEDDPTVYDNFDDPKYDGTFNTTKWTYMMHGSGGSIYQENGALVLSQSSTEDQWQFIKGVSVDFYPSVPAYIESVLKLDPTAKRGDVQLGLNSNYGGVVCGVSGPGSIAYCWCQSGDNQMFYEEISVKVDTWHFFRIEVISSKAEFIFYIDGQNIGSCVLPTPTGTLDSTAIIDVGGFGSKSIKGYIDYVRIGPLE